MSEVTWDVDCFDIAGRKRRTTVFVSGGRVVVAVPPGEVAIFASTGVKELRAALRAAAAESAK